MQTTISVVSTSLKIQNLLFFEIRDAGISVVSLITSPIKVYIAA